jgi:hypothetical protein
MAVTWKINGETVGEGARLDNLELHLVSQGADVLSFTEPGKRIDAAPSYAYGDALVLTRTVDDGDPVTVFRGTVRAAAQASSGVAEQHTYTAHGPWWYLANLVYQQSWSVYGATISRLLLSTDADGAKISAGAQLEDAVNYAISKGAVLALEHDLDQELPAEELRDMTVAEVVIRLLRWHPDRVTWVDYAPATPVLHIQKRSTLATQTLTLGADRLTSPNVTPRHELVPSYVKLIYERIDTVDGVQTRVVSEDRWPLTGGDDFTALVETIDLQGGSSSTIKQKVVVDAIQANSAAWWKKHVPELASADISDLTVSGGAIAPEDGYATAYGNELVAGAIADWMSVYEAPAVVSATASYTRALPGGGEETVTGRPVSVRVRSTDAVDKTYAINGGGVAGETAPVGLARALYESLSLLQYDGSVILTEAESLTRPLLGRTLNLAGGLAAWASMAALIQAVDINIGTGVSTVRFGTPGHLSAGDMIDLLRVGRQRVSYGPAIRTGGGAETPDEVGYKGASGGGGQLGNPTPMKTAFTLPGGTTVSLDGYTFSGTPSANPTLQLRPLTVCNTDGVEKVVWVLASQEMDA